MPINTISSSNPTLPARPEPPRSGQPARRDDAEPRVRRAEENAPPARAESSQPELPGRDAATQQRLQQSNEVPTPKPFARESNASINRQALRNPEPDDRSASAPPSDSRVERADQARDALQARFEESSRPKPEPSFEVRA